MQVTLPKKFEMKHKDCPFVYNDNWISNGRFMIKKSLVKDSFRHCVESESAKMDCDAIIPKENDLDSTWTKTDVIYEQGGEYLRVFKCVELNKTICFRDDYVNHFDIKVMKGSSWALTAPFISDNGNTLLMACRNHHTDLTDPS